MGGRGAHSRTRKNELAIVPKPKGLANSPEGAAKATNPNYGKGREYRVNCQRCIYAFEMNMRGGGVWEALPNPNPDGYDKYAYGGWRRVMEDQSVIDVGSRSRKKVERNINDLTADWGNGARGFITVSWTKSNGHVFNFIRRNGKTEYWDAQVGKKVDIQDYLSRAMPTKTEISRIDNLEFRSGVEKDLMRKVR